MSEDGEVLAEWLLLSNIKDVDAATLALWYYWRWQIECFFKLLKSAG
jgi:IS4 transposase